jgi:uncharacterized protein YwqG
MQRTDIERAFINAGLKSRVQAIDGLTRNSIRLLTRPVDESTLRPGDSKIGGVPDLPAGVCWPKFNGQPQSFLAQIRLADVQAFDKDHLLPTQGMLWFFYDANQQTFGEQPEDHAGWRILFSDDPSARLQRAVAPADLPPASLFLSCALTCRSELTLALDPPLEQPDAHWSDQEQQAYEQALDALQDPAERALPHHRLLGYPDTIQDDMREQCQLVSHGVTDSADPRASTLQAGTRDWLLLLQIDTDAAAKMRWANNGMVYYWIRRADLQACRFDTGWLVLQSE